MTIEIRPVPAESLRTWVETVNLAFGEDTQEEQWALDRRILEPERTLGAYDGDVLVGGGGCFSFRLTVPGGQEVGAAGVTSVGVIPTHRRQGILRQLMTRQLDDVRRNGEAVAILWASEGSIYQRFGYGLGSLNARIDVERERATFRNPVTAVGRVRLVDMAAARREIPAVYDAVRAVTPGFISRSDTWWDVLLSDPEHRRRGGGRKFYALYERDGDVSGYVLYRIKQEWGDSGTASTLMVLELIGRDAEAIQQLWRFAVGVDLIARINARLGPPDHPLLLLAAEPRRLGLRLSDGLWLRVVDVPRALEARRYAADGSVVIEVADDFMPDVGGRWRLDATGGHARLSETTDPPDLSLDITDLAAVYLGAFTFASLARAARTVELTDGARVRADGMFATDTLPWCPEIF